MWFFRKNKDEDLKKKFEELLAICCEDIEKNKNLSNKNAGALVALFSTSLFYFYSILDYLKENKLLRHIDSNANIIRIFRFCCLMQLLFLKERMVNNKQLRNKIGIDFNQIESNLILILEIERNNYEEFINKFQQIKSDFIGKIKEDGSNKIDSRDMWLEQDIELVNLLLKNNFSIRKYINKDIKKLFMFSVNSQETRKGMVRNFDKMLDV